MTTFFRSALLILGLTFLGACCVVVAHDQSKEQTKDTYENPKIKDPAYDCEIDYNCVSI